MILSILSTESYHHSHARYVLFILFPKTICFSPLCIYSVYEQTDQVYRQIPYVIGTLECYISDW